MNSKRSLLVVFGLGMCYCCILLSSSNQLHLTDKYFDQTFNPPIYKWIQPNEPPFYNHTLIAQGNNPSVKFFGANPANRDKVNPTWAYYDPRFSRITIITLSLATNGDTVWCRYFDVNGTELLPAYKSVVDPNYLVHCQRGRYAPLIGLSYLAKQDTEVSKAVNVTVLPKDDAPADSMSVCLSPIFGHYHHWLLLLQFVEFHRLVGASHFFVYVLEVNDPATERLLKFYTDQLKIMTLIQIPRSDSPDHKCADIHRCRHNAQIQDCVYRSIHRFAYTAVIDIDELMVPTQADTLPEMINAVPFPDRFAAYKFRCEWVFRPENDPDASNLHSNKLPTPDLIKEFLPVNRFHSTSQPAPPGHTSKCLVRPERIMHMGVHYVREMIDPSLRSYGVPVTEGVMRHYRNTSSLSWAPHFQQEVLTFGEITNSSLDDKFLMPLLRRCECVIAYIRQELNHQTC